MQDAWRGKGRPAPESAIGSGKHQRAILASITMLSKSSLEAEDVPSINCVTTISPVFASSTNSRILAVS